MNLVRFAFPLLASFSPLVSDGEASYGENKEMTAQILWAKNYAQAVVQAKSEKKPLLVFFTGSDWSGWGMKMRYEILDSPEFQNAIAGSFVCLEVDFPQHKPFPVEKLEENKELAVRFHVEEFPLLLLLEGETEREICRLGYMPESGRDFARDLLRVVEQDRQLVCGLREGEAQPEALKQLYRFAQELRRADAEAALLEAGVHKGDLFFLLEKYRLLLEKQGLQSQEAQNLRQQVLKADADNQEGAYFSLALIDYQELSKLPKGEHLAIAPLQDYLHRFGDKDRQHKWRVEMMIAQYYLDADMWKEALAYAQAALDSAPLEMQGEIQHTVSYIQSQEALALH